MQDEHQAFQNLATRVRDLALERPSEAPSLVVVLSSTANLIEGHVDATATNGSIGGPTGTDRCLVTLPRDGAHVGVTVIWV
jgi:hypothetical protein